MEAADSWFLMVPQVEEDPAKARLDEAGLNIAQRQALARGQASTIWRVKARPIAEWKQQRAYSTAEACEAGRDEMNRGATERLEDTVAHLPALKVQPHEVDANDLLVAADQSRLAEAINSRCVPADVVYPAGE